MHRDYATNFRYFAGLTGLTWAPIHRAMLTWQPELTIPYCSCDGICAIAR